jgi:ABC-type phosphate transport system ATPase subunit
MTAIIGPSGSGKTSLLNFLAKRNNNISEFDMSGTIKANNTILTKAMFMKIGCYVE